MSKLIATFVNGGRSTRTRTWTYLETFVSGPSTDCVRPREYKTHQTKQKERNDEQGSITNSHVTENRGIAKFSGGRFHTDVCYRVEMFQPTL